MPTAELFDPKTATFVPTGSMLTQSKIHTATMLTNGKVLVAGGIDSNGNALATADVRSCEWNIHPRWKYGSERFEHAATLLMNGEVLITGGINFDNAAGLNSLSAAELFP